MKKAYFSVVIKSLRQRQVRSWLTILGIIVGIAAIVSLISIGQGMQDAIDEQFQTIGANRIVISPGGAFVGPFGADLVSAQLTEDDLDVINDVKGVKIAIGALTKTARIEFKNEAADVPIMGMPTDPVSRAEIGKIGLFEIREGRLLVGTDTYAALAGDILATEVFNKEIELRNKVEVEGKSFTIVGLNERVGSGIHDVGLKIPIDTARELFDEPEMISSVFAIVSEGYDVDKVADDIKKDLRKYRDVEEGEEDFTVQTSEQIIGSLKTVLGVVQGVLAGIAAISLLVGGVGIMNTMYTSVLERTKEIGIMKAIGAKNLDIMFLFLIESGIIGIVGGVLGVFLGLGFAKLAELIAVYSGVEGLKASLSPYIIFGALLFSFLAGTLSGVLPARQAAGLKPVEALRK